MNVRVSEMFKYILLICVVVSLIWPVLEACDPGQRPTGKCGSHVGPATFINDPKILYQGWGYPRSLEVNTYDAECFPWISGNGQYLLFASINFNGPPRPGHIGNWDIYRSVWDSVNLCWDTAQNLGPNINTGLDERRPCCNATCDTLYFHRKGLNTNFNIFRSTWNGFEWTPAESLGAPLNTPANEEHPALSADGLRLYFTSDRDSGGYGGKDIWVAFWNGSSWDSVANIGAPVNTPNEETRPFESYDGLRLYFTNQHGDPRLEGSFGGAGDIYVSTWDGTGWGQVSLVAAPVNNDLLACSPYETPDGNEIYFGSEAWEGSVGDEDLWVAKKNTIFPPGVAYGYGNWQKTGELDNVVFVFDLEESSNGIIYAATACADTAPMGKVFRTINGGISWQPCADFPPGTMTAYSLLIDNDTIYVATYPNGDVFKSIDEGNSWVNTAELPGVTAVRGMAKLQNGDILIGTSPYDFQQHNRIFRSTNGGLSWTVTASLPGINPCQAIYQTSSGTVFAGGWGIDSYITVQRSTDNGVTWNPVTVIPEEHCEWSVDAFIEASDNSLYATGWHPAQTVGIGGGFVCRSTDDGVTWNACTKIMRADGVHNCRVYDAVEDNYGRLYVGMQPAYDSVVYTTIDNGSTWYSTGGLDGAYECLCLLRASDGTIYAGTTPNGDVFKYTPPGVKETGSGKVGLGNLSVYPNPCAGFASIRFSLLAACHVSLTIYDSNGRQIKDLVNGKRIAGEHRIGWDGRSTSGVIVPAGVYFCELTTGAQMQMHKMVVLTRGM